MNKIYIRILAAASDREFDTLKDIRERISWEIETMDEFFAAFLERYSLDGKQNSNANWVLYNKKTAEYCELADNLKVVDYYLEKYDV
jgi:hypothetical protein